MVHGPGPRRAARDVGPLLGPHADRPQHRPAAAAAAGQGRGRAGDGRRPRDARPRRRGGRRRRRAAARRRHVDPPRRPRGLQRSSSPAAPSSGCSPTPTRSRSGRSSPRRSCTRSSATAAAASPTRSRPASSASPTRSTWPRAAPGSRSRRATRGSTRSPPRRSTRSGSRPGRSGRCGSRSSSTTRPGIFQVDDLLATKIRGTPLEGRVEVVAEDRGRDRETPAQRLPAELAEGARGRSGAVPCASPACPGSATCRSRGSTKKAITPKQKKVTVLSVAARPGRRRSRRAPPGRRRASAPGTKSRAATVRFTARESTAKRERHRPAAAAPAVSFTGTLPGW